MKKCYLCLKMLDLTEFYKNRSKKDGLSNSCKSCDKKAGKKYREKPGSNLIRNESTLLRRKKRIEDGRCFNCTRIKLEYSQYCIECWMIQVAKRQLGSYKYKKFLFDLLDKQNYKCIYTDELLVPGLNASLDHIESKHNAPDKIYDINNVQWVTKDINLLKGRMSHNQFIDFCKYIANKF